MPEPKRVAIIGGGLSGIVSTKIALEHGLQPVCFEARRDIGGIWFPVGKAETGYGSRARTYEDLTLNTSRPFYEFSDFNHQDAGITSKRLFDTREEVRAYLDAYAERFGLLPHVRLGSRVTKVAKAPTYADDGAWDVTVERDAASETSTFSSVILCTGHFAQAWEPELPGREAFQGTLIHSAAFDGPEVFALTRQGFHIVPVYEGPGVPIDLPFLSRQLHEKEPEKAATALEEVQDAQFDLSELGVRPKEPYLQGAVTMAKPALNALIRQGKLEFLRGQVERLTPTGIRLGGRAEEVAVDAIVVSTGYRLTLPYLEDSVEEVLPSDTLTMEWYRQFFPLRQAHQTLFCVGLQLQYGAYATTVELLARAACGVISGQLSLPPVEEMAKEEADLKAAEGYLTRNGYAVQHAYHLGSRLAKFIGCFPDLDALCKLDPELAAKSLSGPMTSAHYRLLGPHAQWERSRREVMGLQYPMDDSDAGIEW